MYVCSVHILFAYLYRDFLMMEKLYLFIVTALFNVCFVYIVQMFFSSAEYSHFFGQNRDVSIVGVDSTSKFLEETLNRYN